ncbi:MAG: hypothetical protein KY457_03585 [Actinobacteria bacterium]|nr:hypothetical protein [Actinomycetota bacterium]
MAGALTERAFVDDLHRAGFVDVAVVRRRTYGLRELESEPLFTPDLLAVMRRTIPADVQARIGNVIVVTARRPS